MDMHTHMQTLYICISKDATIKFYKYQRKPISKKIEFYPSDTKHNILKEL